MLSVLLVIYSLSYIIFQAGLCCLWMGLSVGPVQGFFLILCVSFTLSFLLRRQFLINEEIKIEQEMFQWGTTVNEKQNIWNSACCFCI